MNRYSFIGNIGRDAEMRTLDSGSTAISFTVAVTEKWTDKQGNKQETTTWVSCTLWRTSTQSTAIANYLKKGQKVLVEGKPSVRAYEKQDGTSAASLDVKVDNIELLGGAPADSGQATPPANSYTPPAAPPAANPKAEEDLPF